MKPPAFQFYADDFIGGTVDMTTEEVGAYIRLLCYQWGHGKAPVSKEAIDRVAGCTVSSTVLNKFRRGKNVRLEAERRKQIEYREKQAINGAKGGRPPKRVGLGLGSNSETQTEPKKSSPSPSPSPSPVQLHKQTNNGHPSLAEVKTKASMTGMLEVDAEAFWHHFESSGWIDKNGNPVVKWESKMATWKTVARSEQAEREHHGKTNAQPSQNRDGRNRSEPDYSKGF
jgi:uncharacterized protein YdaU (DUF1376 family)